MKFLLFAAAVIAVAVASPARRDSLVEGTQSIIIGPALVDTDAPVAAAPIIADFEPVAVVPEINDIYEPISVAPALVEEFEPIAVGPVAVDNPETVEPAPVAVNPQPSPAASSSPLVKLVLNINASTGAFEGAPVFVVAPGALPSAVSIIDNSPVAVVDRPVPMPFSLV